MPGTGSASVEAQGWVGEPPAPEPDAPETEDDED